MVRMPLPSPFSSSKPTRIHLFPSVAPSSKIGKAVWISAHLKLIDVSPASTFTVALTSVKKRVFLICCTALAILTESVSICFSQPINLSKYAGFVLFTPSKTTFCASTQKAIRLNKTIKPRRRFRRFLDCMVFVMLQRLY